MATRKHSFASSTVLLTKPTIVIDGRPFDKLHSNITVYPHPQNLNL